VLSVWILAVCPAGTARGQGFVAIQGDQFTVHGQVYKLKGTNYYPKNHMWADMWNSWSWGEIKIETAMMRDLGLNCVRILVPYSHGGWNGPNVPASRLQMLEDIVNLMGEYGIRSCVTLFDWETSFPAAGTSKETDHYTYLTAIVNRLRNNPYVFMWDVKNEPDHPANLGTWMDNWDPSPNKAKIVSWLNRMCNRVRQLDPNHPVSAGIRWWQNVDDVIGFIDVAIFHSYWPNIHQQITDVKGYMGANLKPILVEEYGWPSHPRPCYRDGYTIWDYHEAYQRDVYANHLTAFAAHNIAGGMQWMTFDARSYGNDPYESFEHFFGLWRYDYSLKPAGEYYRDHFPVAPFPGNPPGPVRDLAGENRGVRLRLTWRNPADVDFRGTVVRYSAQGYPAGPTDGQPAGDVPGLPNGLSVLEQVPPLAGTYYYAAFSYDATGAYGPVCTAGVTVTVPGDLDADGDVDMKDFGGLQGCLTGQWVPQTLPECQVALMDLDDDVDEGDVALFRQCLTGAGVVPDPGCGR